MSLPNPNFRAWLNDARVCLDSARLQLSDEGLWHKSLSQTAKAAERATKAVLVCLRSESNFSGPFAHSINEILAAIRAEYDGIPERVLSQIADASHRFPYSKWDEFTVGNKPPNERLRKSRPELEGDISYCDKFITSIEAYLEAIMAGNDAMPSRNEQAPGKAELVGKLNKVYLLSEKQEVLLLHEDMNSIFSAKIVAKTVSEGGKFITEKAGAAIGIYSGEQQIAVVESWEECVECINAIAEHYSNLKADLARIPAIPAEEAAEAIAILRKQSQEIPG